jgi:RHS repeat-associated protein
MVEGENQMIDNQMMQVSRTHASYAIKCGLSSLLLCLFATVSYAQGTSPMLGFRSGQPYASGGIDSVSMNNGNVMVRLPLASLPRGRGGLSAGISLMYQSKTSSTTSGVLQSISGSGEPITWDVKTLDNFLGSAWQYQYQYSFNFINRRNGYSTETEPKCPFPEAAFDLKLQMNFPDGSTHIFRPVGFNDFLNDGFFNVGPDGYGWTCSVPVGHPAQYTLITSQKMVYYSIDGTYIRLEVEHDADQNSTNNPWTLFFPDGSRVTGGNAPQRIYDRNNNFVEIQDTTYNSHPAKRIVDQFNREVIIEFDSATNRDFIRQRGVNNEEMVWTVKWKEVSFNKSYLLSDDPNFPFPPQGINASGRMVDQIILPSQAGTLAYTFHYNAASENPPPAASGWGELSSITLPSGANIGYRYQLDGQDNVFAETVVNNAPTHKDLTYLQEYDETATSVTETWQYYFFGAAGSGGSVVAPDGGISGESFDGFATNLRARDGWNIGVSLQSDYPDGSKVERYWRPNTPFGSRDINPFVKTSFTSIRDAAGEYSQTAITDYNYDKNGNITRVAEYDWVPYSSVARDGNGRPTGEIPATAQPKRITTNTQVNETPDASIVAYDADAYIETTSARLRNALASTELSDASQVLSRTEFTYDNASITGNPTEQKSWDSQKGGYSNPLIPSNSISVTNQYNANVSGQLTQTTDARGSSTEYTYGLINGFSDLYPTETRLAAGTTVQRKETREYDFYTGVLTRITDVDNNVSTVSAYDVFGRPTLVKVAEGKPEETRTLTEYSDVNRRVIVRGDLNLVGDGKLVTIQHYDQLGRTRLTRQLEQFSTAALTDEKIGIKVQTRYLTHNPCQPTNDPQCMTANSAVIGTYVVMSNPYRAAHSTDASTEPTMGWSRRKSDRTGRDVEAQTFAGAVLPAPWSTNSSSTGTVTTGYDGIFTTVTDQAGKVRRSMTDALGRMVRVDEPSDINNTLGDPITPAQATNYVYDAFGNLKQVSQGPQNRYFNYTSLSRLKDSTSPEGGITSYVYDANGNLTTKTDPRLLPNSQTHVSIVTDYDQLNRITLRTYNDGTPAVTYTYDDPAVDYSKGRLTSVSSSASSYSYGEYDPLGRIKTGTQTTAGQPYTMTYSYNRAGGLVSQQYPSGLIVKSEYDEAGRLAGVKKDDASNFYYAGGAGSDATSRFQYSATGGIQGMRLGNGLWEHTNFNSRLQIVQIGVGTSLSDSSKLRLDYTFGVLEGGTLNPARNNGNPQSQTITLPGVSAIVQNYEYDELNRLKMAQELGANGWTEQFSYDRFGNRNGLTISQLQDHPLPTTAPEVDPNTNRIKLLNPQNQATGYDYDDAGNMTKEPETGGTFKKYFYDSDNRVRQATRLSGATETVIGDYVYDGDGKRVKTVIGAVTTIYVYNILGQMVAEYTDGAIEMGGISFISSDTLGSTRLVTDSNQEAKERHDYLPFGEEVPADYNSRGSVPGYGIDNLRQKFTSKERDDETGLDYYGARYCASVQGRFISPDPLLESGTVYDPQTWNRYSHTINNPLKYTDPDGLYVFSDELGGAQTDDELRKGAKTKKEQQEVEEIIKKRDKIRNALNAAREAEKNSAEKVRAELEGALGSYGEFKDGTNDNVVLGLVQKKSESSTTALGVIDGKIHVDLNLDQADKNPIVTIAHEGSHVADFQDLLAHRGTPSESSYDLTGYETEQRAYFVSSFMAQALNLKSYYPNADENRQVWNRGWKETKRETNRVRGVTAKNDWNVNNQGPKLSDPRYFNKRY